MGEVYYTDPDKPSQLPEGRFLPLTENASIMIPAQGDGGEKDHRGIFLII